jgi:hypothetical protein
LNQPELPKALADELFANCDNPLPITWVRALFARLSVKYGAAWIAKWKHIPDESLIHAEWAKELSGVKGEAIAYALKYLPDDPPNAQQFRRLCNNYRSENAPLLLKEDFKRTPESDAAYKKFREANGHMFEMNRNE